MMNTYYSSKSDIVARGIRELIRSGDLMPGSVLRQRELADRFRVSPTPVREALRQLETEGLVTNELHRGATVARAVDTDLEENRLIRARLETLAADLAATRATDEDLQQLSALLDDLLGCPPDDDSWSALDRRFHFAVYECARSPMLLSLLNLVWHSLQRPVGAGMSRSRSDAQHRDMFEALMRHDADAAAQCALRHVMDNSTA